MAVGCCATTRGDRWESKLEIQQTLLDVDKDESGAEEAIDCGILLYSTTWVLEEQVVNGREKLSIFYWWVVCPITDNNHQLYQTASAQNLVPKYTTS